MFGARLCLCFSYVARSDDHGAFACSSYRRWEHGAHHVITHVCICIEKPWSHNVDLLRMRNGCRRDAAPHEAPARKRTREAVASCGKLRCCRELWPTPQWHAPVLVRTGAAASRPLYANFCADSRSHADKRPTLWGRRLRRSTRTCLHRAPANVMRGQAAPHDVDNRHQDAHALHALHAVQRRLVCARTPQSARSLHQSCFRLRAGLHSASTCSSLRLHTLRVPTLHHPP
jgi:hypothetical protein